ncbi:MAG: nucleotidyltransferase family protein, partial [Planctomycetaceae bacterium]
RLCVEFGVQRLELFGSACTSAFDPSHSDLDFLVEFPAGYHFGPWMSRFVELRRQLAELFGRPVDLVMPSALENRFFREDTNADLRWNSSVSSGLMMFGRRPS